MGALRKESTMKVRTTSWHYRLWRFGRETPSQPRDLCRYFWHLVLIKIIPPIILVSLALLGIGSLAWVIWGHPLEAGLVVFFTVLIIALIFGIFFLIRWLVPKLKDRRRQKRIERQRIVSTSPPLPPKDPNPFWEFLKARKRKMCPLIEVVEKE
jgi:hypothetical protein